MAEPDPRGTIRPAGDNGFQTQTPPTGVAVPRQLPVHERGVRQDESTAVELDRVRLELPSGTFNEPVHLRVQVLHRHSSAGPIQQAPGAATIPTGAAAAVPQAAPGTAADASPKMPRSLRMPYVVRIEATGQSTGRSVHDLSKPVKLTFDFSSFDPWSYITYVHLYRYDTNTEQWVVVPGTTDMVKRTLTADVQHFSDFGFGGDLQTMPSPPPNLEGFSTDLCSGTAAASIPLQVPPGINGLTPRLELRYNSGSVDQMNGNFVSQFQPAPIDNSRTSYQASTVGLGWTLDVGAIFRDVDMETNTFSYFLVLNGRTYRLTERGDGTCSTNPDEYQRVVHDQVVSYESRFDVWTVQAKDGTIYTFGDSVSDSTAHSTQWAGKTSTRLSRTATWAISGTSRRSLTRMEIMSITPIPRYRRTRAMEHSTRPPRT